MASIESEKNLFGGRTVVSGRLPEDPREFANLLEEAISEWREGGTKVVWLDLAIDRAGLIAVAADAGFRFHHAREDGVLMTLRLVEDAYIPPYATHYIGAGGVVIKDGKDLLCVSERYRRGGGRHLKLPGGALHPGEHIADAVRREILEETGIETVFRSLVCFRHWHGYRYGKSDIYFVCRLDPVTFELCCQDEEIEECLWIPVEEYLESDDVHTFNRRIVRAALDGEGVVEEHIDGYGTPEPHEFFLPAGGKPASP